MALVSHGLQSRAHGMPQKSVQEYDNWLNKIVLMSIVNYFIATTFYTDEARNSSSKSRSYSRLLMVKG